MAPRTRKTETPGEPVAASYREASDELERILQDIEDPQLPIDQLAAHVERATLLIRYCKDVLRKTGLRVSQALESLDAGDDEADEA